MSSEVADISREPNALRRYELLSEHTRDIVLFIRPDGRILEANRAAVQAYGYSRRELLAMTVTDLRAEHTIPEVPDQMVQAKAGGITFETMHRRRDGSTFPVEVSSSPSEIGGVLLSVIRDITARKRTEKTQALLGEIDHRLLEREPTPNILQMICDRMADLLGYTLVWIAMKQPGGEVGVLAHAGVAAGFLEGMTVRWDETPEGLGPTGAAIRLGQTQLVPISSRRWDVFRHRAEQFGIQTGLSLPLNARGETLGALSLYAIRPDAFDEALIAELSHFANQVAISLLAARDQEQIRLLMAALDAAANAVVMTDLKGNIQWVNRAFTDLTGYTREEAMGANPRVLKSGTHGEEFYRRMWESITEGKVWRGEVQNRRKDGTVYTEEMTITPVRGAHGAITHFIAIKQEITRG